jgi:hypothetical protein
MLKPVSDKERPALVIIGVAGVADGDGDEAGFRQRKRRVVMVLVGAAIAVGHHDQRQVLAGHGRAQCHRLKVGAERMHLGRRGGRVPDAHEQRLLVSICNSQLGKADPSGLGADGRDRKQGRGKQGNSGRFSEFSGDEVHDGLRCCRRLHCILM